MPTTPYNPLDQDWTPEDTSVANRVTGLLSNNNPLMQQARTQGAQYSNRRGLLNSSMGAQAGQTAAYGVAMPIASQEASQAHQRNMQTSDQRHQYGMQQEDYRHQTGMQGRDIDFRREQQQNEIENSRFIANLQASTASRASASQLAAQFENSYAEIVANIMANTDMPAEARESYLRHAALVRDNNLRLVEQFYGIDLEWDAPGGGSGGGGGINNPLPPGDIQNPGDGTITASIPPDPRAPRDTSQPGMGRRALNQTDEELWRLGV